MREREGWIAGDGRRIFSLGRLGSGPGLGFLVARRFFVISSVGLCGVVGGEPVLGFLVTWVFFSFL